MNSKSCKVIIDLIKSPIMKAQILFVSESASFFSNYSKLFQCDEPMIHRLYQEVKEMLLKLAGKVYKMNEEKDGTKTLKLLPMAEMKCSAALTKELAGMKESEKKQFLFNVQKHYVTSYNYLKDKMDCNVPENLLSDLQCLMPEKFKLSTSEAQILALGKALLYEINTCDLLDEWRMLKFKELPKVPETSSVDKYWSLIFNIKNSSNGTKYPVVAQVVKAMLSLSHGSASVERGFSTSGNVLTHDKSAMNERGLNARLNILSGMKKKHF